MKALYILLAIALIGVGFYWFTAMDGSESMDDMDNMEESMDNDMNDDDMESMDSDSDTEVNVDASVSVDTDAKVFNVAGVNYEFDISEITVQEGDTVTINFTSTEGFHDWVVDEFDAATAQVSAGNSSSVTFVADAAGTYEFYCSVGSHRAQGMVGTLVVEPA